MKTVYEIHQAWVEYGEPAGPGDYYDRHGYDLKASFDRLEDAEAEMKRLQAESPEETFQIRSIARP